MPRQSPYLLRWSSQLHIYEISAANLSEPLAVVPDGPGWLDWLESTSSFAFRSRSGAHYTARKESIRNGFYWYGYRSLFGRTIKHYLGRTASLSIARLEEVATRFANTPPQIPEASPALSSPLLTSRLQPPRLPLALVERPHLFDRLDAWRAYKLTLLQAPAGFGKTTLVNSWLTRRQASQPFVWISLEASDNDPVHFWRSIIDACQLWQQDVGKTALAHLLTALQPPFAAVPLATTLTFFINDLARKMSDAILILDDYQVIVEPRLHESIIFFLEHLPARMHVIILTRREPALPLARWRAQGDVQELHTTDLRFSSSETATFLRQTTARTFSAQSIEQLDVLLQGWPAGLRLLVLAAQATQGEIEQHLSTLGGPRPSSALRRQLRDYFVGEVLDAQPEPLQLFLLQTSTLSRLTGPLCDAITGRQNSAALLETIERAGLFLEALDEAWYRYHSLFAEAMRAEADRRLGAETLRAMSRCASQWYEQHALAVEAIEAALQAHDPERAAILIERFGSSGQRYELHTLRNWLERIPDAVVHAHPALCLYSATALQFGQEVSLSRTAQARVNELLQRAEENWLRLGKLPLVGLVFAFRALTTSMQGLPAQEAAPYAAKALALFSEGNPDGQDDERAGVLEWRIICLGIVGTAKMHQGNVDEARQCLLEALALSRASDNQPFVREVSLRLGAICMALGELHQAGEYYRQALASAREQDDHADSVQALSGLARLSIEWNDLAAAEQWTNEAAELARREQQENDEVSYLLALLHFSRGQEAAASFLASLLARLQASSPPGAQELLVASLALQIRLQLMMGDLLSAHRSLALLTASTPVQSVTASILQARLQFAEGHTDTAVQQLEQLLPTVQEQRYLRCEIEILLLLALARAACKQKENARQRLQQALQQAHGEGFLRVFLSEGEPLARLLRSLLPTIHEKLSRSYGQALLRAFAKPAQARTITADPPHEPLSTREQRVLQLICTGRTNPEIAAELIISVNTVKDHVKHIYRKLGVSSRTDAREMARRLNYC